MNLIEKASNMLIMETEEGEIVQKANNARNRLKYGVEVPAYPELFESDTDSVEFNDGEFYIYPTQNSNVFVTQFPNGSDLPIVMQNSAGTCQHFLSKLEEYLITEDIEDFKQGFTNPEFISDSTDDGSGVRLHIIQDWFNNNEFTVKDEYIQIGEDILLLLTGEAILLESSTDVYSDLIFEFNPMINYMYKPVLEVPWSNTVELTTSEIYLIHRVTYLYDKIKKMGSNPSECFNTKPVQIGYSLSFLSGNSSI